MSRRNDFERLVLPHLAAAHNLAYWLVRSRPDAEDVVQDAMLRAYRSFETLRGESVRPWLLAIVRNVAFRWLAQRSRLGNVVSLDEALTTLSEGGPERQLASDAPSAEAVLISAAERNLVLEAIALLAPMHREVIVLREIEDLSYREIADIIKSPIGTVMSRLSRARLDLKAKLETLLEGQEKDAM